MSDEPKPDPPTLDPARSHPSATGGRVAQRCVMVLPTTAEFDSRTYRIASTLAGRGHSVTVLARAGSDLPAEERHPSGYRIVRVQVSAVDGLPLPTSMRRRLARRRSGFAPLAREVSIAERQAGRHRGLVRRFAIASRRGAAGAWRMTAVFLTVRSQARRAKGVDPTADLYHAMAYMGIPVALDLAAHWPGAKVVYDARDIYMDAGNLARLPRPARALLGRVERRWARRADRVMTVNRPYAEVMSRRWDVPLPAIVLNCAYRSSAAAARSTVRRFHDRLGLAPEVRVVLYHGGWSPGRGIEQLLDAIKLVDDAVLVLLGYGILARELAIAAARPDLASRVFLLPAVPPEELLDWVACADVVAMPIQPTTLNHRLTTPNKLFEAMAAGVPVVASDLPGMSGIVTETGCGLLCDPTDPAAIAGAIRAILDAPRAERALFRARALEAADATYNWETQVEVLLAEYGRLTGQPW